MFYHEEMAELRRRTCRRDHGIQLTVHRPRERRSRQVRKGLFDAFGRYSLVIEVNCSLPLYFQSLVLRFAFLNAMIDVLVVVFVQILAKTPFAECLFVLVFAVQSEG